MPTFYKFLNLKSGKITSHYGNMTWKVGREYSVVGDLFRCRNGLHASIEPLDALSYVKGEVLALVEASGDSDNDSTKVCYRKMKIVRAYRWTKEDSVQLAIFAAELVLPIFETSHPTDQRPRNAITAAKAWLANPSEETSHAAAYAAAAASAAYDAAYAASAAERKRITKDINQWIKSHIDNLEPINE